MSSSASSRRSGCATRSLPQNSRLPSCVGFDSRRRATGRARSGRPNTHNIIGTRRVTPGGAPTSASRETRVRRLQRECDRPQPAHRVPRDVDRIELERVEDLTQEHDRVLEDVDAVVVERVSKPMPRAVDGEDAVPTGQRLRPGPTRMRRPRRRERAEAAARRRAPAPGSHPATRSRVEPASWARTLRATPPAQPRPVG